MEMKVQVLHVPHFWIPELEENLVQAQEGFLE
jgi:hypothetical protein